MHKAATHAIGLLMTGPYADTLTATSNYFKYTGEGQNWTDRVRVRAGGGGEVGKRNTTDLILDYVKLVCCLFFSFQRSKLKPLCEFHT